MTHENLTQSFPTDRLYADERADGESNLHLRSRIAGLGATLLAMPYTRRPTWPATDRLDYVIAAKEGVPISGLAIDLDGAAAQFKQAYERMRAKAGLPMPQR